MFLLAVFYGRLPHHSPLGFQKILEKILKNQKKVKVVLKKKKSHYEKWNPCQILV